MGWLDNLLDVAGIGLGIAQLNQLNELKQQGASKTLVQAVLNDLRQQIFNYKQAAENILETEKKNPRAAAGAMCILKMRLQDSGITPNLFLDLNDKDVRKGK